MVFTGPLYAGQRRAIIVAPKRKYATRYLSKKQKKAVSKMIETKKEKEVVHLNGGIVQAHVVQTTYSVMGESITDIDQGTTTGTRIGNKVKIYGVWLQMRIRTTNATVGDYVTVCILRDRNNQGSSIAPGNFFQNNTNGFAPVSMKQDDSATIAVWKKSFPLNPNTAGPSQYFHQYIKFKNPITVTYFDSSTTGVDGSVSDNVMSLFSACFASAATTIDYTISVNYSDV